LVLKIEFGCGLQDKNGFDPGFLHCGRNLQQLSTFLFELLAQAGASGPLGIVSNSRRRRRLGLKEAGKERVCRVLKNRWIQLSILERFVELLGAQIEDIDLIVYLLSVDPVLKPSLVKDGFDEHLRSGQELRVISGKADVCAARFGAGSNIEIEPRISVLIAGR